jgi:hypothetical protein
MAVMREALNVLTLPLYGFVFILLIVGTFETSAVVLSLVSSAQPAT